MRSKRSTASATASSSGRRTAVAIPGARGLRLGLRFTLLIALLPLLTLPWIGLRFFELMAQLTRDAQVETQQAAVRGLAASLHERRELFGAGAPALLPLGVQQIVPFSPAANAEVDWTAAPRLSIESGPMTRTPGRR